MYTLKMAHGALTIRPCEASGCELWLNDVCIHSCGSASEAALVVAQRATGYHEIDGEDGPLPSSIEGWRWISVVDRERWQSTLRGPPMS
jgi:hypothetical protein